VEIEGKSFTALNGGPHFKFNEAISFQIPCETQEEIDHYRERLSAGGEIQQCGWLKGQVRSLVADFPNRLAGHVE
jgi:predicted 3-demethylubiquinone-9 3-methyltransferase (glyoxalase superfamily)